MRIRALASLALSAAKFSMWRLPIEPHPTTRIDNAEVLLEVRTTD